MRIRSIKPEFWTSEDIAQHDWPTRLLFIGLWSYVDDNGVGRDNEKLIKADLFPLEDDPRDTLATVSRGLQALCDGGQITRYTVDGRDYLYINAWSTHQRIDRPNKARYPLPDPEKSTIRDTLATPSRHPRETPLPGAGEQGNRGTGDRDSCASADAEREFDDWWSTYPRKKGKGQAAKAYRAARKKTDAATLLAAIRAQHATLTKEGMNFCPYPATWLNGERWNDDVDAITETNPYAHIPSVDQLVAERGY